VSHPNFAQVFASYIDGAMEESGIPIQQDFASGHLLGRQYAPLTISYPEEERSSSQSSFLNTALRSGRSNLKVYPNMLAKRIVFNGTMSAMGVEVSFGCRLTITPNTVTHPYARRLAQPSRGRHEL
jgi:choline dehydrogenase